MKEIFAHREVLFMLARKDFQTRYKRAALGVLWAVAVPALQATVMAVVFSHVVRTGTGRSFPVYIVSGIVAYSYFSATIGTASTAIVDGTALTEKVWFPRALLVFVPCITGLVGTSVTLVALVAVLMPVFSVPYTSFVFLLVPAMLLLFSFTVALGLVLAALHVYFRDVRYLVQASLLVWLYVSPVLYPEKLLGHLRFILTINPLTGIVTLFHLATLHNQGPTATQLGVSIGVTAALVIGAMLIHQVHDRLFVDQM